LKNKNIKFNIISLIKYSFALIVFILLFVSCNNYVKQFSGVIYNKFLAAISNNYDDISRIQRLGTIKEIVNYMLNNGVANFLLGNGFRTVESFMQSHTVVISGFTTTDNQYMSFFYEFGFLSLILYVVMIILTIIKILKNNNLRYMNCLSSYIFLSISINMFFYESFGWTDMFILLMISLTFMSINKIEKRLR
jgi:hypothetical protein